MVKVDPVWFMELFKVHKRNVIGDVPGVEKVAASEQLIYHNRLLFGYAPLSLL